jgi:hypothetical protein
MRGCTRSRTWAESGEVVYEKQGTAWRTFLTTFTDRRTLWACVRWRAYSVHGRVDGCHPARRGGGVHPPTADVRVRMRFEPTLLPPLPSSTSTRICVIQSRMSYADGALFTSVSLVLCLGAMMAWQCCRRISWGMACLRVVNVGFASTRKLRLIACVSRLVRHALTLHSCDLDWPSARRSARIFVTTMSTVSWPTSKRRGLPRTETLRSRDTSKSDAALSAL